MPQFRKQNSKKFTKGQKKRLLIKQKRIERQCEIKLNQTKLLFCKNLLCASSKLLIFDDDDNPKLFRIGAYDEDRESKVEPMYYSDTIFDSYVHSKINGNGSVYVRLMFTKRFMKATGFPPKNLAFGGVSESVVVVNDFFKLCLHAMFAQIAMLAISEYGGTDRQYNMHFRTDTNKIVQKCCGRGQYMHLVLNNRVIRYSQDTHLIELTLRPYNDLIYNYRYKTIKRLYDSANQKLLLHADISSKINVRPRIVDAVSDDDESDLPLPATPKGKATQNDGDDVPIDSPISPILTTQRMRRKYKSKLEYNGNEKLDEVETKSENENDNVENDNSTPTKPKPKRDRYAWYKKAREYDKILNKLRAKQGIPQLHIDVKDWYPRG